MTHFTRYLATALLPLSLAATACAHPRGAEDFLEPDEPSFRSGTLMTGKRLNTNHRGDHWFDNVPLGGQELDGVLLHQVVHTDPVTELPEYVEIPTIDVVDGELHAELASGMQITHLQFQHTVWTIEIVSTQSLVDLAVEVISPPGSPSPRYAFYYDVNGGEERLSTCELPSEEGPDATAVVYRDLQVDDDGVMSVLPDSLYIGCINGAVGKASEWGYRPDYGYLADGPWDPLPAFEAAVRMIRADYCGDGVSYTQAGTPIFVDDDVVSNNVPGLESEAVWGLGGALCLDQPRIPGPSPTCANGETIPSCGSDPSSVLDSTEGMFWTKSDPNDWP